MKHQVCNMVIVLNSAIELFVQDTWAFLYYNALHRFEINEEQKEEIKYVVGQFFNSIPPIEFSEKAKILFEEACEKFSFQKDLNEYNLSICVELIKSVYKSGRNQL